MKVNAILDDASNGTILNEEVAGVLGLQEFFQKVQVHILNDSEETFQSMPLKIEIESFDGKFSKEISVKTCPQKVTGNYRVGPNIKLNGLTRPSAALPSPQTMDSSIFGRH